MQNIKKIPYVEADYGKIKRKNMFYIDKTRFIHELENLPNYLFLIRPRRFGKSLWVNLLQYYYDINMKDKFEELFKDTYIGQHPTSDKNSFLTIAFNFSMIKPSKKTVQTYFERYIQRVIEDFLERYHSYFSKDEILKINTFSLIEDKLQEIFFICSRKMLEVYLFIDEYDNFTNTILTTSGTEAYIELTHGEGQFKHFFNLLKGLTSMPNSGLSKLFITGVSPVTMDDVTSGFNIGTNISLDGTINEFMGFTETEVRTLLNYYNKAGLLTLDTEYCLDLMKKWYNNYSFSSDANTQLFNSDMILFFCQKAIIRKTIPEKLIDQNIKIDYKKLRYLVTIDNQLNGNFNRLKSITFDQEILSDIEDSFPVAELTKQKILYLYYTILVCSLYKVKVEENIF
ncbi:MAG: AAA-ATPase [Candidatus Magnetoglobus multicellularis str. Araruama]|uniref:AAA-ATPase n=1 Tax=Candidatus Magnetoglobus multicellularis str. Araruama TaxID=890399 RepID=A0A1V1PEK9_9BACT|nr:MAG: AAA-ATPase [Candidatus Magnetoglobus multicellularis str. Araruama]